MAPKFAQLVIGPPGAGKSTYCYGMHQFLSAIGRPSSIVNLDPANDQTAYEAALDVRKLVSLEEIASEEELGPNGSVLHAIETLEKEFDWLQDGLSELGDDYILFDCPGQVELFTHHRSLRNIFFRLQKMLDFRLVVLHLVDSFVLTRPSLYISALLLSLRSMLQLDLPSLNILTKIDNLKNYPALPFDLEFYTQVHDLSYLVPFLDREQRGKEIKPGPDSNASDDEEVAESAGSDQSGNVNPVRSKVESKFTALNEAIVSLVDDFSLVAFEPLVVDDKSSMAAILNAADRASGYAFGADGGADDTVWQVAVRDGPTSMDIRDVQERWIDRREEFDELEKTEREMVFGTHDGLADAPAGDHVDTQQELDEMDMEYERQLDDFRNGMPTFDSSIKIIRTEPGGT